MFGGRVDNCLSTIPCAYLQASSSLERSSEESDPENVGVDEVTKSQKLVSSTMSAVVH